MILCKEGSVQLKGSRAEIQADYTCIVRAMMSALKENWGVDDPDKVLDKCRERAGMSVEELMSEVFGKDASTITTAALQTLAKVAESMASVLKKEGENK